MDNLRLTEAGQKYDFHEVLEIWLSPMPHFNGAGPHRYDTGSKHCSYCLRPKNFDPKPFMEEVA